MTDISDFINTHKEEALIRNEHYVFIPSLAIPPRSRIRNELIADGWKHKQKLSRKSPFSCFVMPSSQFSTKQYFPSPEAAEDMVLINLFIRPGEDED